jgi:hypothetical protein
VPLVLLVFVVFVVFVGALGARQASAEPDLEALTRDAPRCDAARAFCFGLAFHIAVGEDGPVATADWITGQLAGANRHFAPLGVGFQITGVTPLPAAALRVKDRQQRNALGATIAGTVVDVFVTGQLDDVDIDGGFARGVTWPGKGGRKFIIISTQAPERVLAHELGHVFGLPHSRYPISIMNKTPRDEPPVEQRTFADEEIAVMRSQRSRLVRDKALANLAVKP